MQNPKICNAFDSFSHLLAFLTHFIGSIFNTLFGRYSVRNAPKQYNLITEHSFFLTDSVRNKNTVHNWNFLQINQYISVRQIEMPLRAVTFSPRTSI